MPVSPRAQMVTLTPFLDELGGDGQSEPSGRAGDDGDFAGEAEVHAAVSVRRGR